ncbi:MAG: GNAT family N-acetyltransferase [Anaerolineales bacterium]
MRQDQYTYHQLVKLRKLLGYKSIMIISEASVGDALLMMQLHERSIMELCRDDYTQEQLKDWLNQSTLEKYQVRLEKHRSYIAERDGKMIGYVRWNPETNELCSIFVDPACVRQGIATDLMNTAYKDARKHGVKELWLDASNTAVPFYEAIGWDTIKLSMHGSLEGVRMTKRLSHGKVEI